MAREELTFWRQAWHVATEAGNRILQRLFTWLFINPPLARSAMTPAEITELLKHAKRGDIILTTYGLLCQDRQPFVHAILYLGDRYVVHALAEKDLGVNIMDLAAYLPVMTDKVVILRPKNHTPDDIERVIAFALFQVGKKYDFLLGLTQPARYICTNLVAAALSCSGHPLRLASSKRKSKVVAAEAFLRSPDVEIIWSNKDRLLDHAKDKSLDRVNHRDVLLVAWSGLIRGICPAEPESRSARVQRMLPDASACLPFHLWPRLSSGLPNEHWGEIA
ncbi:MAG: hypothetical protein HY692_02275 [Cyanobacteria bacterium NC_groundwater_1444_Ag_S-0.65um_54_12]|nr:hypothetical protein [Cyanobacteria bacterium NC_groundwater_1444_Ag_S-0.65um_54_12]